MVTVTAHDGRTRTVEIDESMLSPQTLAKCSYFNCIAAGRGRRPRFPLPKLRSRDEPSAQ